MNSRELFELWSSLNPPAGAHELEARELSPASGVWAAIDHQTNEHLLVEVPESARLEPLATHGMSASVCEHRVKGRDPAKFIDLACLDEAVLETFGAVAAEIAHCATSHGVEERLSEVAAALSRWKWFWSVDPSSLSRIDAVGLFGELWFLARWARSDVHAVSAWTASDGSRHDFQWDAYSVEVKTTSTSGATVHHIDSLEQLEAPERGVLFLFSLRLSRDALARNSLQSLVAGIAATLDTRPDIRDEFWRKLSARGYTPADPRVESVAYRVLEESLFRVDDDFPRLTRASFEAGLPPSVGAVSYELDVSACSAWLVGTSPDNWPPDTSSND